MMLTAIFEPSDEGGYTVYVPALPGCISEGDTLDQARANIREAIHLYLEQVEEPTEMSIKTEYPALWAGLDQLPTDGLRRALEFAETEPNRLLLDGSVALTVYADWHICPMVAGLPVEDRTAVCNTDVGALQEVTETQARALTLQESWERLTGEEFQTNPWVMGRYCCQEMEVAGIAGVIQCLRELIAERETFSATTI